MPEFPTILNGQTPQIEQFIMQIDLSGIEHTEYFCVGNRKF